MKCDDWCAAVAKAQRDIEARLNELERVAEKLEDESKALVEADRARQPWWRRWRW